MKRLMSWTLRGALVASMVALMLVALPGVVAASPGWTISSSPNKGTGANRLSDVSCVSPGFCMAVGGDGDGSLIESWHGKAWRLNTSPKTKLGVDTLQGVSCPSTTSCKGVGFDDVSGVYTTLVESWNGKTWTIIPSPNVKGTTNDLLGGVSCTSSSWCVAVGESLATPFSFSPLVEYWNGKRWSVGGSADGDQIDYFNAVSCTSTKMCVAVGESAFQNSDLVESWNGTDWTDVTDPGGALEGSQLPDVSCATSTSCTAVGSFVNASDVQQTLIESRNGTAWMISPSPNRGADDIQGVFCISSGLCRAVGSYSHGSTSSTLVEVN
jgi:hypothetical protein